MPLRLVGCLHLQTLMIITRPAARILILGLALAVRLTISMRPVDLEKTLALGLEHLLVRIIIPTIDKVPVKAISHTDLFEVSPPRHLTERKTGTLTSPQANLIGGTPFQPPGIALRVSYRTLNLKLGILFQPAGHLPPGYAPEYPYSVVLSTLTQSGNLRIACRCALHVLRGNAARSLLSLPAMSCQLVIELCQYFDSKVSQDLKG